MPITPAPSGAPICGSCLNRCNLPYLVCAMHPKGPKNNQCLDYEHGLLPYRRPLEVTEEPKTEKPAAAPDPRYDAAMAARHAHIRRWWRGWQGRL